MISWGVRLLLTVLCLISGSSAWAGGYHLSVVGATGSLAYLRRAAADFESANPGYTVSLSGGGSVAGLIEVSQGRADLALSDILPRAEWTGGRSLRSLPLGRLPVIVIAHQGIGVNGLSLQQLKGVLTGRFSTWQAVGGAPVPVVVITRPLSSGAREAVEQKLLGGQRMSRHAVVELSNGAVLAAVRETPGALGFIEAGQSPHQVQVLGIGSDRFSPQARARWPYYVLPRLYWRPQETQARSLAEYLATRSYRGDYGLIACSAQVSCYEP